MSNNGLLSMIMSTALTKPVAAFIDAIKKGATVQGLSYCLSKT